MTPEDSAQQPPSQTLVSDSAKPESTESEAAAEFDYTSIFHQVLSEEAVKKAEKAGRTGFASFIVAVLVALPEELEHLHDILPDDLKLEDHASGLGTRVCEHTFTEDSSTAAAPLSDQIRVTYLFRAIGQMGELEMAYQTQFFQQQLAEQSRVPHLTVLIGIAGAIKEVRLGDVVVADKVVRYFERSKIIPDPSHVINPQHAHLTPFTVQFDQDVFQTDERIINFLKTQFTVFDEKFNKWVKACETDAAMTTYADHHWPLEKKQRFQASVDKLRQEDHIAIQPRVIIGAVASGPSVIASSRFKWLLLNHHNRNYRACEMESGGFIFVLRKSEMLTGRRISFMVLRGISDNSDELKSTIDGELSGRMRRLAMRNAIRVLFTLMELRAFRSKLSMA